VRELASLQTRNLEDQDLSRVISPSWVAFTMAKDFRIPEDWALNMYYLLGREDL
jgi:hypothetical protein